MKLLIFIPFLFLVSCATEKNDVNITPVNVNSISKPVSQSQDIVKRINDNAKVIFQNGTPAKSEISESIVKDSGISIELHKQALDKIVELQKESDNQADELKRKIERLNYLENKYSEAVGLLWKWRFICIGTFAVGVIAGGILMAIFRLWLKANIPIRGSLIP